RGQVARGAEPRAVGPRDFGPTVLVDEMGEAESLAQMGGEQRALVARAEQPYFRHARPRGHGVHAAPLMAGRQVVMEEGHHVLDLLRIVLDAQPARPVAENARGPLIAPRRAADPEIDA